MKLLIAAVISCCISLGYSACISPYVALGDMCIHVVDDVQKDWDGARDYCKTLAEGGDLVSAPTCDQFTLLARYMELNDLQGPEASYYVGVSRPPSGGWFWLTLQSVPLGVPFWAYDKGNMDTMNCAEISQNHNYQLSCSVCATERNFICSTPPLEEITEKSQIKIEKFEETIDSIELDTPTVCQDGIHIGHHCYVFYTNALSWEKAEEKCREDHFVVNGFLFYPDDCEEFTAVSRHLSIDEPADDWWVGARDATGDNAWFWPNGGSVSLGVPFWAFDEPSHTDHGEVKEHCSLMAGDKKFYLKDEHCDEKHSYICKYHVA